MLMRSMLLPSRGRPVSTSSPVSPVVLVVARDHLSGVARDHWLVVVASDDLLVAVSRIPFEVDYHVERGTCSTPWIKFKARDLYPVISHNIVLVIHSSHTFAEFGVMVSEVEGVRFSRPAATASDGQLLTEVLLAHKSVYKRPVFIHGTLPDGIQEERP